MSYDTQLDPVIVGDDEEYQVEEILDERTIRRGRGSQPQVLVKWTGYAEPTWEPRSALEDTAALDSYEQRKE